MIFKKKLSIKSHLYSYHIDFNFKVQQLKKQKYKNAFYLIDKKVFRQYELQKIISKKRYLLIKSEEINKSFKNLNIIFNFFFKNNIHKKNIIIERGDAKDFRLIYKILNLYKPKLIFHTAAIPLSKIENLNANESKIGSVDTTTNILECINFFQNKKKGEYIQLWVVKLVI